MPEGPNTLSTWRESGPLFPLRTPPFREMIPITLKYAERRFPAPRSSAIILKVHVSEHETIFRARHRFCPPGTSSAQAWNAILAALQIQGRALIAARLGRSLETRLPPGARQEHSEARRGS